jgi:hypothetical protein
VRSPAYAHAINAAVAVLRPNGSDQQMLIGAMLYLRFRDPATIDPGNADQLSQLAEKLTQ